MSSNRSTSNYEQILLLATHSSDRAGRMSRSTGLEFPRLQQLWNWVELRVERHSYNIFAAWVVEEDLEALCHNLRDHLLWLSGRDHTAPHEFFILAEEDTRVLEEKGRTYGDSWARRGGVGAFMMLARKWDRIENIVGGVSGASMEQVLLRNPGDLLDDIADLRRYLLLVEDRMLTQACEPTSAYLDQDPD